MINLSYRAGQENTASLEKAGVEKIAYTVDFTAGMPSSATISAITTGAVNSSNADVTTNCVSSVTTTGVAIATVLTLTCGTSGTQAATNLSRFRLRTQATLSNGDILVFDAFLRNVTPTYGPGSG